MHLDIDKIEQSFAAISPRLDELTMNFYTDLFMMHPELKPFFGGVDLMRQRRKLAAMLTLIVTNLRRMDVLIPALRLLGARHVGYGTLPEHYACTEASLLRALERVAGDLWDDHIARAWSSAISLVSSEMLIGAQEHEEAQAEVENLPQSDDIDLLMEIASNPSLSFQRNSLFSTYVDKKKTDHELGLARTVQQSLIPPEFPSIDAYHFTASYEPATQVGGDYYDWAMPSDDRICFIFGDVSGKGLPGALIMCRLAGAARAVLGMESDASRVLTAINAHLCDRMPGGQFVTLAFLSLHLPTHCYTLANAGHAPPLYRKSDGTTSFLGHETAGLPVGIEENATYDAVEGVLEPGDTLVFYTDGVNEALDRAGQLYGSERLKQCAAGVSDSSEMANTILEDVRQFAGGRPQSDDLTILSVGRLD